MAGIASHHSRAIAVDSDDEGGPSGSKQAEEAEEAIADVDPKDIQDVQTGSTCFISPIGISIEILSRQGQHCAFTITTRARGDRGSPQDTSRSFKKLISTYMPSHTYSQCPQPADLPVLYPPQTVSIAPSHMVDFTNGAKFQ